MSQDETRGQGEATYVLFREGRVVARKVRAVRLRVRSTDGVETIHEVERPSIRVGSKPACDLVLADDAVSRLHFEIGAGEHGFVLRDLGSTNGTFVDGARVGEIWLRPGCRIRAGRSEIVFEPLERVSEVPLSTGDSLGPLLGKSAVAREMFALLESVAPTDATVLLEGESGTGKELVAHAIHETSQRSGGPFVVFDCAAVHAELLESELFGHEKGAFTGAVSRREGAMEEADGGTIFLDEIGELPLELQPKLLRALENREVRRVGSTKSSRVDVRIVAATNRDLAVEVNRGGFREDLYYRLAVVRVRVPPLRERREDIPMLVEHFARRALAADPQAAEAFVARLGREDYRSLQAHSWPGNVRELRNVVERTIALQGKGMILEVRPAGGRSTAPAPAATASPRLDASGDVPIDLDRPFHEQRAALIAAFERRYLEGLLSRHEGNLTRAASAAGLDRAYFRRILRRV